MEFTGLRKSCLASLWLCIRIISNKKTEIIIEHFRQHVKQKLARWAKAMVVTGSRLHAVRYMLTLKRYIEENHSADIHPLVAFSGTVKDPDTDLEYTEPSMNIDGITGKPKMKTNRFQKLSRH
jgi:type I restriction enzyme R subunit